MGVIAHRTGRKRAYPLAAGVYLPSGEPALLANGYLTTVAGATGTCVGVATRHADNSSGAQGERSAEVSADEHKFQNAGDITLTHVGATAYLVDASTLSIDSNSSARPAAGTIVQVDSDGVWLAFSF